MKSIKKVLPLFIVAFITATLTVLFVSRVKSTNQVVHVFDEEKPTFQHVNYSAPKEMIDLSYAAENSVHSVVHIKTQTLTQGGGYQGGNPLYDLFGYPNQGSRERVVPGAGSGVILSPDGYIVTNNHVIENAKEISVTLNNNRTYSGTLVGTDPNTDIALIKIDGKDLPYMNWGSSEDLSLGEWVLAVGNPFNLTSTVTAGIISAKSRSIQIMGGPLPIESFIQTDAAVNPGNSGGALVNTRGELIGINTAIASKTGSYSGYSFAVPSSIAKKVVADIKEFGEVQRALLGIRAGTVDERIAEQYNLEKVEGVYVSEVTDGGAAKEAGIVNGDIILKIDKHKTNTMQKLQEVIAQYRPGDEITVHALHNSKVKQFKVVLRNTRGDTGIVKDALQVLGAQFAPVGANELRNLSLQYGVQAKEIGSGRLKEAGIKKGFIITDVNRFAIKSVNDLKEVFNTQSSNRPVLIEGVYPDGESTYYILRPE